MTKKDITCANNSLVSQKYSKLLLHTAYTGGTTGPRVALKRNLFSIGNEHAFVRRQFDWAGIALADRCAYMTWRTVVPPNRNSDKTYSYDPCSRELILSTFHLTEDNAKKYIDAIQKYKVKALIAYPSAAAVLAKSVLDNGSSVSLRSVLTTSENLGKREKSLIMQAFKCPVFDFYGTAERTCYIHTCEFECYHIIPEYGLTELIPAEPPYDDCYRIIATGFWNMAMPLIRYQTDDLVKIDEQPCSCGREFTTIKQIIGRQSDSVTTSTGRIIGPTAISRLCKNALIKINALPIIQSQIIKEDNGTLTIEYIPAKNFSSVHKSSLLKICRQELPLDFNIKLKQVDKATKTVSGKSLSLVKI